MKVRSSPSINWPSPEYFDNILRTRIMADYDDSPKSREEHDELIAEARKLPLDERIETFRAIYGRRDYAER